MYVISPRPFGSSPYPQNKIRFRCGFFGPAPCEGQSAPSLWITPLNDGAKGHKMDDRNKAGSPPDAKTVMAPNAAAGNAKEKTRLLDDSPMFPVGTPQPSSASMREHSAPVAM